MSTQIIDPTGALGLIAKYQKALAKGTLDTLRIEFTATGVAITAKKGGENQAFVPVAEAMASPATAERPFGDEKAHIVSKYEVRLDEEAPSGLRNATSMEELNAAIAAIEFRKRRALQMSNKDFESAYVRWTAGTPVPRTAEQAEMLRQERAASRGGRGRGRGRGGRGRGSFRGAEAPAGRDPQPAAQAPAL